MPGTAIYRSLAAAIFLFVACNKQVQTTRSDAAFFGGSDLIVFRVHLAHSEIKVALDLLDSGVDPSLSCASDLPHGICGDKPDEQGCSDLRAVEGSESLRRGAVALLSDESLREELGRALDETRFEVVASLPNGGRHNDAIAPIGRTDQAILYSGPVLQNRTSLVAVVAHEHFHVIGLTDDIHDELTAAGTCLFNLARNGRPEDGEDGGGATPAGMGDITPLRDYTGTYDLDLSNRLHVMRIAQNADGTLAGEISGIPGVVGSATLSGKARRTTATSETDEIEFTWNHGTGFASAFSGRANGTSIVGTANGTPPPTWTAMLTTSLYVETFVGNGINLATFAGWTQPGMGGGNRDFKVVLGELVKGPLSSFTSVFVNTISRTDGKVSAFVVSPPNVDDSIGLLARYLSNGDFYYGALTVQSDGSVKPELWKNEGGSLMKFASGIRLTTTSGLLELEVRGTNLILSLDGSELLNRTDNHISGAGGFGIRANHLTGLNTFRISQ